jgi:hypothetical protein
MQTSSRSPLMPSGCRSRPASRPKKNLKLWGSSIINF